MGKYGSAAVMAVRTYTAGRAASVIAAWEIAVQDIFPNSLSSQVKGCPKGTFLGVCGSGHVIGMPAGYYTASQKNKQYGLKAVALLRASPSLADDQSALWRLVLAGESKVSNHQMDVITSLWKAGLIKD